MRINIVPLFPNVPQLFPTANRCTGTAGPQLPNSDLVRFRFLLVRLLVPFRNAALST